MYRVILEFRDDLPEAKLYKLKKTAAEAFNNRVGTVLDKSPQNNVCIFEGAEDKYGCLSLGNNVLLNKQNFYLNAKQWEWEDSIYQEESHDVLATIKYIKKLECEKICR